MRTTLKRLLTAATLAMISLLALPVLAFASEAEEGGGSAMGVGLLFPSLGEWIPMLIGFIVLWVILAKFGWPAFIGMIDKRTATIKDSLERAEAARIESEHILEENKLQLDEAKKQATQIIADAKVTGDTLRAEIMTQAQEDARLLIERANSAIETEKKAAIAQLQSSVADLSVSIAGRLIGSDLNESDHRRLIEHYLAEAGNLNAN
ncbi:MAG: F0F1 ATP synthase subunit B [Coriobacteriia bacterium]|nr:F0F1 ATP synthase subunit B [Coriobacteriia bacterium]